MMETVSSCHVPWWGGLLALALSITWFSACREREDETWPPERWAEHAAVGCYEIEMTPWRPKLDLGLDSVFITPPHRIRLDTVRSESPFTRDALRVVPIPWTCRDRLSPCEPLGIWQPLNDHELGIVWTNGFSGFGAELRVKKNRLEGTARTFWDFPRREQSSKIIARSIECLAQDSV